MNNFKHNNKLKENRTMFNYNICILLLTILFTGCASARYNSTEGIDKKTLNLNIPITFKVIEFEIGKGEINAPLSRISGAVVTKNAQMETKMPYSLKNLNKALKKEYPKYFKDDDTSIPISITVLGETTTDYQGLSLLFYLCSAFIYPFEVMHKYDLCSKVEMEFERVDKFVFRNNFTIQTDIKSSLFPLGLIEISGESLLPKFSGTSFQPQDPNYTTINNNDFAEIEKPQIKLTNIAIINSIIKAINNAPIDQLKSDFRFRKRLNNWEKENLQ